MVKVYKGYLHQPIYKTMLLEEELQTIRELIETLDGQIKYLTKQKSQLESVLKKNTKKQTNNMKCDYCNEEAIIELFPLPLKVCKLHRFGDRQKQTNNMIPENINATGCRIIVKELFEELERANYFHNTKEDKTSTYVSIPRKSYFEIKKKYLNKDPLKQ